MDEKLNTFLRLLLDRTKAGLVGWEYITDNDMIRAKVGDRVIRIGEIEFEQEDESGLPVSTGVVGISIWVIDSNGHVTDEFELSDSHPLYPIASEILSNVTKEAKAKRTESALDELIQSLSPTR